MNGHTAETAGLTDTDLRLLDGYWRAANYLSVGQVYLLDNPLLREPLRREHVKPRLLGHFGTTPGLNLIYAHMNRAIRDRDLDAIYVTGPGHGGPALVANAYLERTYTELYSHVGRDLDGLRALFRQFSFPGGIPSHAAPELPGSIHEGGELGYALAHAFGAAFDNPDLVVCCVVGDGEAETGPLAASWHSNKFLNARTDGAVLPFLHLNGYKIANPTVLARIPEWELNALLEGYGWEPFVVSGSGRTRCTGGWRRCSTRRSTGSRRSSRRRARAATTRGRGGRRSSCARRRAGPGRARSTACRSRARGDRTRCRSSDPRESPEHLQLLEDWLRSYRPEELFDEQGRLVPELAELPPRATAG